ncbi:Protein kinase cAMP-dependent regulatory subunit type 2 [Carabus blaptoides fortunei]
MNRPQSHRIQVPDELREVLLEFTISYLLEQPGDIIGYAVDYFQRLRDNQPPVGRFSIRRKSVFAETYNPEDDEDDGPKVVFPKSDEQRQSLTEAVHNILLFRALDKEQMQDVLDAMFEKKVSAGDYIIKQGDDGDNFYVIQDGIFHAYVAEPGGEPKRIHTYNNCGSFGELALLYNMPRAATIQADSNGSLWAMDRQTFRRILLKSAFKKRKMYEALIESVPMLKTLQAYERMNLADALIPKNFTAGDRVIKQGDAADGMYFIEAGTVTISVLDDKGNEIEINRLSKGGYFGELALVTHRPRAASVIAVDDLKLAFLDVEAFERLLGPCMQIMKRNITDYEDQILKIFGSKANIKDIR